MRIPDNAQAAIDERLRLKIWGHDCGPIDPSIGDIYHKKLLSKTPPESVNKLRHHQEAGVRRPKKHGAAAIQMETCRKAERAIRGAAHGDLPSWIDLGHKGVIRRLCTEAVSPKR